MTAHVQLYLISPPELDPDTFQNDLERALQAGPVASFQLRLKGADDDQIRQAVRTLMPVCVAHDVAFILNDRADLAAELGCDGVHLGQGDGSVEDARKLIGDDAAIGVTCHDSRHLAFEAGDQGADYVAFGAFFPSSTKKTKYEAEPEILSLWSEIAEIPCVAIGGITPENCPVLIAAGADFLAVSSYVWGHPQGPATAVKAFHTVFNALEEENE